MKDSKILKYNKLGLIPGPNETEDEFERRVEYCLSLSTHLPKIFSDILPETLDEIQMQYGLFPSWVPVIYDNRHLAPWHGGCAWIFQEEEELPTGALLQLRRALRNKDSYLGIYSKKELISHEICHAGRMMYEEPQFEEMLAYQTSSSAFRRNWGSIVRSSVESMVFVGSLACVLLIQMLNVSYLGWGLLLPLALLTYGIIRQIRDRHILKACYENVKHVLKNSDDVWPFIYRLTDEEICAFSRYSFDEIQAYSASEDSLRWKVLKLAYPYFSS